MVYTDSHRDAGFESATPTGMTREVAGLFVSAEDLQNAVRDLEGTAFPRQDISVMGSRDDLQNIFGTKTVDPHVAMENPDTPRQALPRSEEKVIGAGAMVGVPAYIGAMAVALSAGAVSFPAIIGAAVIGGLGGGTLGGIMLKLFGDRDTRHYEEQIEKGGLLLWVRTPDHEREEIAEEIMRRNNGREVHAHDIT